LTEPPPAATTVEEAQSGLDIEFAVERDGAYGVVTADDEYIPLGSPQRPTYVQRLQASYVASSQRWVEITALDGSESVGYELPADEFTTVVRSDAEAFAANYYDMDSGRTVYTLFPGDARGTGHTPILELAPELMLEDWSDSVMVLSGSLIDVTGGDIGTHHFNVEYDWGLETAAVAGYESVVVADTSDPRYVCVADLQPGVELAESEECGYLGEGDTDELITFASVDEAAPGLVTEVSDTFFEDGLETEIIGDAQAEEQLLESEHQFVDPLGRWQIAFGPQDVTWALLDTTGEEASVSQLRPPEGALMPVVSHN
ncbi:hypothetical protein, partial [Glycomyces tenuis]